MAYVYALIGITLLEISKIGLGSVDELYSCKLSRDEEAERLVMLCGLSWLFGVSFLEVSKIEEVSSLLGDEFAEEEQFSI